MHILSLVIEMNISVKGVGDGGLILGPDREITRAQWLKDVARALIF